jgi:hypothetical protein
MKDLGLTISELETPGKNELLIQALGELHLKIIGDKRRAKNKKQLTQLDKKEFAVEELIQEIREQMVVDYLISVGEIKNK